MNAARTLAATLACCALGAALAASAPAATIPGPMAHFSSVQIDQGRVLWFQRNNRSSTTKKGDRKTRAGVGAIYARTLDGGKAERVYLPPKGSRIVAFKAAHGRIAVGLATIAKDSRGPTSIVDLKPSANAPWAAAPAVADPFTVDATTCGSRVSLVGIAANSDLIVLKTELESRGKDCVLVRQVAQAEAVALDGTVTPLKSRKSGWSIAQDWNLLPQVVPAGGQLLQLSTTNTYTPTPLSLWNRTSGDYTAVKTQGLEFWRIEQLGENGVLFPARSRWGSAFIVPDVDHFDDIVAAPIGEGDSRDSGGINFFFLRKSAGTGHGTGGLPTPATPTLPKANPVTWFHACGARILRIKSAHTRHHRPIWSLAFVDLKGKPTEKLEATLPAGTGFDGCDASAAVFHRRHKDQTARQWSVKLAP